MENQQTLWQKIAEIRLPEFVSSENAGSSFFNTPFRRLQLFTHPEFTAVVLAETRIIIIDKKYV